jgi:hypothetical protein
MKTFFLFISACLITASLWANPIVPPEAHVNELYLSSANSWTMEVSILYLGNDVLTHLWLQTPGGLVEVNNFTYFSGNSNLWFTNANLVQPVSINPQGDILTLVAHYTYYPDTITTQFAFGNVNSAIVQAPRIGQSISRQVSTPNCYNSNDGVYAIDNSPTLGMPNDTAGTCGNFSGIVYDLNNNPVQNFTFILDFPFTTDNTGHFYTRLFSRTNTYSHICYQNHDAHITPVSYIMEPDSSISVDIHLLDTLMVGVEDHPGSDRPILKIFPNPVGNELISSFSTDLSANYDDLSLRIFDIAGRTVAVQPVENRLGVVKMNISLENGEYFAVLSGNGISLGHARFIVLR